MARIYANLIEKGVKTYDEVMNNPKIPDLMKDEIRKLLTEDGWSEDITNE